MPCYHPAVAYQGADGAVHWVERSHLNIVRTLTLSCGQCIGCRLERSRQWAVRCMHEASLYPDNCFVTLTYSDEHLPDDRSLYYRHFQLFMKRLIKHAKKSGIRFYMCGEYGEEKNRPHYHAVIFNFDFPDKTYWSTGPDNHKLYKSELLDRLWGYGGCLLGSVTFQSAAYVARYVMKKVTGYQAYDHYECTSPVTGEITQLKPEFNSMSRGKLGGIGAPWLRKFQTDVYPHDEVVVNGVPTRPPRFYDKIFQEAHPQEFDLILLDRHRDGVRHFPDNSDRRLADKETVAKAKIRKLKRTIE